MPQHITLTPVSGGPLRTLSVPTSWADITLADFLRLQQEGATGETSVLAILLGLDVATVECIRAVDVAYLCHCLAFVLDASELLALPASADLPDIGAESYGLLRLATDHVQDLPEGTPGIVAGPYLYALYRCQQLYGKVDDAKVEAMRQAVLAEPVTTVYADVAFFLSSYRHAISGTRPTPTMPSTSKMPSWMRALKRWASASVDSLPSTA
ncbi:hypothetical protein GCM10023185_29820 [Hymenobacter saemangeumensis]|uniref:Uncharacterized protein n=1 Tax=Hymenobacter saemangeumensis TaxID=1084522 RepID=A0ABP8IL83_9BACT